MNTWSWRNQYPLDYFDDDKWTVILGIWTIGTLITRTVLLVIFPHLGKAWL